MLISQTARCSDILKKISSEPATRDNFFKKISLKDLLDEIARSFQNTTSKEIKVISKQNNNELKIDRSLEITYGLRNFIGNAVKFSKSYVKISLEVNEKFTEVKIIDDGPGFHEDIIEILGEPYIKSQDAYFHDKSGLGLGTFIGKTLLTRKKATINFSNCLDRSGAIVAIRWKTSLLQNINS